MGGSRDDDYLDRAFGELTRIMAGLLGGRGAGSARNRKYSPGERLKILFVGYSGAGNIGAELRVVECERQLQKILGAGNIDITLSTLDAKSAAEFFQDRPLKLAEFNAFFFKDLHDLVLDHHLVALVEGACWKENFSPLLLYFFDYAAALAARLGKPCFGYGLDAGPLGPFNRKLTAELCRDMDLFIARSDDSAQAMRGLGFEPVRLRTDTGWTYETLAPDEAGAALRDHGWDGERRLLGIGATNFFVWPVRPAPGRWLRSILTQDIKDRYRSFYYFDYGPEDEAAYERFAQGVARFADHGAERGFQPLLIVTDAREEKWAWDMARRAEAEPLIISCARLPGRLMASIHKVLDLSVCVDYHATLYSLAGGAPVIGLYNDERIPGLMKDFQLFDDYCVNWRAHDVGAELMGRFDRLLQADEELRIKTLIAERLPAHLALMARMGADIRALVREKFPGLELPALDESDPLAFLPSAPAAQAHKIAQHFREIK